MLVADLMEAGDLGIPGGMALTERLLSELRGFRVSAWKNDLAFAVALAGWRPKRIVRDLWGRRRLVLILGVGKNLVCPVS